MSSISQVVRSLQKQQKRSKREFERLGEAIKALGSLHGGSVGFSGIGRRKPKFSAAARERIAAAQRARWAKIRAAQKK
jgi:hypothetical protein